MSAHYPQDDEDPDLPENVFASLRSDRAAYRSEDIGAALTTIADACRRDPMYAWGWHCNLAVPMQDEGMDYDASQRAAARIMFNIFGIDTLKNENFSKPTRGRDGHDED